MFHKKPQPKPENDWLNNAFCRDSEKQRYYYSTKEEDIAQAKAFCGQCAVKEECLEFALINVHSVTLVMGGLTGVEREVVKQFRRELKNF